MQKRARTCGMSTSAWVLAKLLPSKQQEFQDLVDRLAHTDQPSFELAALNDFLAGLDGNEIAEVLMERPRAQLSPLPANQVAAMVEHVAYLRGVPVPGWVNQVEPLQEPYFATALVSLRLHLLVNSPLAFRRRNLYVDATVGDRV